MYPYIYNIYDSRNYQVLIDLKETIKQLSIIYDSRNYQVLIDHTTRFITDVLSTIVEIIKSL